MYSHIEDILVDDSKIAKRFDERVFMDKEGNIVNDEKDSFGCKVIIDIQHLDMCIVMDELGCNLSQENDKVVGGQKYFCGENDQLYQSVLT